MDTAIILKKLFLKNQNPILIINPPEEYQVIFPLISAEIHSAPVQEYDFIHVFVMNQAEVQKYLKSAAKSLRANGHLWISYPKKSSKKYQGELSRGTGWDILSQMDFEPVTQISLNDDWTALRFRPVKEIKTFKRKSALSAAGQDRIGKKQP